MMTVNELLMTITNFPMDLVSEWKWCCDELAWWMSVHMAE